LTGIFGWFPAEIAWSIAGLLGFGSIAALRAFIDSKGAKTYVLVGLGILNSLLYAFGVYSPDPAVGLVLYQKVSALIASLTIGAVAVATKKVEA
jgi:hypothetical protein